MLDLVTELKNNNKNMHALNLKGWKNITIPIIYTATTTTPANFLTLSAKANT